MKEKRKKKRTDNIHMNQFNLRVKKNKIVNNN